jgi:membrane protease YdiL (CAAX protease family)
VTPSRPVRVNYDQAMPLIADGRSPTTPASPWIRVYLAMELVALYWVLPTFIDVAQKIPDAPRWLGGEHASVGTLLIPALGAISIPFLLMLVFSKRFPNRSLWNWRAFSKEFRRILVTAFIAFVIMVGLAALLDTFAAIPEEVAPFRLLRERPILLVAICVLYPIFSVYPQEIILRTWFFHRYSRLIPNTPLLLTVNALTFAWVHVIFQNVWAVVLCIPAGFLFGYTYLKTKSTLASGVEHALVGNLMWISGLGWFFYAGSVAGAN